MARGGGASKPSPSSSSPGGQSTYHFLPLPPTSVFLHYTPSPFCRNCDPAGGRFGGKRTKKGERKKLLRPSTLLFLLFFPPPLGWVAPAGDFGFWGRGGTTAQRQTGRQTGCGVEGRRTGGGSGKKRFPPSLGRKEKWKGPSSRKARLEMEKRKKPNLTDMMD